MRTLAMLYLIAFCVGLPILVIYAVHWSKRRQRELHIRYGRWTENEAKILQRQATDRGDWKSSLKWAMLSPVTNKRPLLEKYVLVASLAALLILCGLALLALIVFSLTSNAHLQLAPAAVNLVALLRNAA